MAQLYKLVTFAPASNADAVREAVGNAGANVIGNYSSSALSVKGTGRYKGTEGLHPAIGNDGELMFVEEERIEVRCSAKLVQLGIEEIKKMHVYEEIPFELYKLESFPIEQ